MKSKKSTIKFRQKKGKERLKQKVQGAKKSGVAKKKGGPRGRSKGRSAEREELKAEGKQRKESQSVDEFLDQDFALSSGSEDGSDGELSDSGDSLSPLDAGELSVSAEAGKMKDTLESLKDKDPEFYKYLQETDNSLLEFDEEVAGAKEGGFDDEGEEADKEAFDAADGGRRGDKARKLVRTVDSKSVRQWCDAALGKASLKAVQNLLKCYRAATHLGEDDDAESLYFDSVLFNELMHFVLKHVDSIFRKALHLGPGAIGANAEKVFSSAKWKKVGPLVRSYLGNTLHLLSNVTDATLSAFVFQRLRASVDLFAPFHILSKKLLKLALRSFGTGLGDVAADRTLRIQSVLVVRALAQTHGDKNAFVDDCYKSLYRTFQSCAKFVNNANIGSIHFMQDCIVEVLGVNPDALYKFTFLFIREVALLLRNALTVKSKEAYQKVYSWQVISSLNLFESIVSRYGADDSEILHPLIYPLVQVFMLTATLVPSSRYLPLRFQVLKAILRLSKNTNTFIPLSSTILEALNFSELTRKPSGVGNHFNFNGILKVPKPALKTISFQEQCVAQVVLLLAEHCNQWSNHIAFPELFLPLAVRLKVYLKSELLVKKFKIKLAQLMDAGHRSAERILVKRQLVNFSPKHSEQLSLFMKDMTDTGPSPIGKLYEGLLRQMKKDENARNVDTVWLKDEPAAATGKKKKGAKGKQTLLEEDAPVEYEGKNIIPSRDETERVLPYAERLENGDGEAAAGAGDEDRVEDFDLSSSDDDDSDPFDPMES